MHVAVVILNYNGRKYLEQFLPTLITYTPNARIIVADNCSTDDSVAVLKTFPTVEIIQLNQNYGYAGGYNEALKLIDTEYYILVNSDIEVTENWTVSLTEFLTKNKEYAAIQPKILDFNAREKFEYAGAAGGFLDTLGYPYCRGRIFDEIETDYQQYDNECDIFWSSGACFAIRSKVFHELGGFDASFFAHMEEIDLCWRIKSAGLKTAFTPKSIVYHVGGGTLNKQNPNKTFLNFRNGIWLLLKNLPKYQLVYKLPMRIFLDIFAAILLWKKQGFIHFLAVFKAHVAAFAKTRQYLVNNLRSSPRHSKQEPSIIAFTSLILRKKKYAQLNNTR